MTTQEAIGRIQKNVEMQVKGKRDVVRLALIGLIARGHILIEDVPGVGKTLLAHTLAQSLGCNFSRIQCTSDLLPSDIIGISIYNQKKGEFEFRPGPLFTNILLADEINRSTPKTQSALLQAMNDAHVSIDQLSLDLPQPFLVFATQNPIEHQGTYPLPEAQKDRFMLRIRMGYPDRESERSILSNGYLKNAEVKPVVTKEEILQMQKATETVSVESTLMDYILTMVETTRKHPDVKLGASTRAALHLVAASKAHAILDGRDYLVPEDVRFVASATLSHRLILKRGSADIMEEILQSLKVPI